MAIREASQALVAETDQMVLSILLDQTPTIPLRRITQILTLSTIQTTYLYQIKTTKMLHQAMQIAQTTPTVEVHLQEVHQIAHHQVAQ